MLATISYTNKGYLKQNTFSIFTAEMSCPWLCVRYCVCVLKVFHYILLHSCNLTVECVSLLQTITELSISTQNKSSPGLFTSFIMPVHRMKNKVYTFCLVIFTDNLLHNPLVAKMPAWEALYWKIETGRSGVFDKHIWAEGCGILHVQSAPVYPPLGHYFLQWKVIILHWPILHLIKSK